MFTVAFDEFLFSPILRYVLRCVLLVEVLTASQQAYRVLDECVTYFIVTVSTSDSSSAARSI